LRQKTNTTTIQFEGSFGPKTNTTDLRAFFLYQKTNTTTIKFEDFSFAPGNQHNYNPIGGFLGGETPTQLESKLRVFLHQKTNTTRIKIQDFFALENQY
jgi:hypothetical protein